METLLGMILLFQVVILVQIMLMKKQLLQQLETKSESREDNIESVESFKEENCIKEHLQGQKMVECEVGEDAEKLLNEVLSEVF